MLYKVQDEGVYAHTGEHHGIYMLNDERFDSSEHATMVLEHELGHQLLDDFYVETPFNNPDTSMAMKVHIESQCDVAGVFLFKLAEKWLSMRLHLFGEM